MSVSLTDYATMAGYVSKACWMANYLNGQELITAAQATASLAAYNTTINSGLTVASLSLAAQQAEYTLNGLWLLGTLKAAVIAFAKALLAVCPDQDVFARPIAHWATVIYSLASTF
jgi:hypothetical protein